MAVRARDTGEQGDTVRYTQDTEEGTPVRDWVLLGPLTVEHRKKILESRPNSNSKKTTDMSASPKLKPRKKPQQVMKMKKDVLKTGKMTPGERDHPRQEL